MRKCIGRSVGIYFAFIVFALAVISALFPVHAIQKTSFSSGAMGGVFEPMGNETELIQCFQCDYPVTGITFRLATYMEKLEKGNLDVRIWDAKKESVLWDQTIPAQIIEDNSYFTIDPELQPGTYYLSFNISGLEADKRITFYTASGATQMLGGCALNGEPIQSQMYFTVMTDQKSVQMPKLALVLIGLSMLAVAISRDWSMLSIMALGGVLCACIVGIAKYFPNGAVNCRWYVMPMCAAALFAGLAVYLQKEIGLACVLQKMRAWVGDKKKTLLKFLLLTAGCLAIGAGTEEILFALRGKGFFAVRWIFFASVLFTVGCHILFWKQIKRDFTRSFLVVAMTAGLVMCVSMPMETGVSWDDQIHFQRSVFLAEGNPAVLSRTETMLSDLEFPTSFSMEDIRQNRIVMEEGETTGTQMHKNNAWSIQMIGYLPYVIGRWIGEALSLPFWCTLVFSRMVNVVCYVLVLYAAMRRLKSGQVVVYVLGMLPTGLFLAATYSYDAWVNCLTILGFSYFVGAMQRMDEPLTVREILIMLSALVIGCIPKAVYTVMIPVLLLMPKEKFREQEERRRYVRFVLTATAVGILVYAVPFLMRGAFASSTDARGGADVDAVGQVKYILLHPLQYAYTLLRFLWGYLSPEQSYDYVNSFSYLDGVDMHTVTFTVMIAAALTDRGPSDLYYRNHRIMLGSALWIFITLCAVASALYITFTPVGHGTVNGCQPRYLIPVLFPLLMLAGNIQIGCRQEQKLTKYLLSGSSAYITFSCIWETVIQRYTL